MTIEEMKKNLNRGITEAELLRDFQNSLKEAKKQIIAERVKADTVANARKQLAQSICNYAKALYDVDADVAEITVMLKDFENDNIPLSSFDSKIKSKCKNINPISKPRKTESDDDIIQAFVSLFS